MMNGGTAFEKIDEILSQFPIYQEFRNRSIDGRAYLSWIEENLIELLATGIDLDDLYLSTRTPASPDVFDDHWLQFLKEKGVISGARRNAEHQAFLNHRSSVAAHFKHEDNTTYIYPEEERLAYLFTVASQPSNIAVAGCYYGYLAAWLLTDHVVKNGQLTLIDTDAICLELAKENLSLLAPHANIEFVCDDAVRYLESQKTTFDMIVLDAEDPKSSPHRILSGKSIYYDILSAANACTSPGTNLLCHNIILTREIDNPHLESKSYFNRIELAPFVDLCRLKWGGIHEIPTTEGIGIASKT